MFIQNGTYKPVSIAGMTLPIMEGTVITVDGVTGIVTSTVESYPATRQIAIAIGGTIDMTNPVNSGIEFTEEMIQTLGHDFNFIPGAEGGGGSSLPEYTSSDVGKVLTLGEDAEHAQTVVIVPEQTVTFETPPGNIVGADFSNVTPGDVATMTVNGSSQTVTATLNQGAIGFASPDMVASIVHLPDETTIFEARPGTYTVSLTKSVPAVAPVWETGGMVQITIDPDTHSLPLSYNDLAGLLGKKDVVFIITDNGSTIMYRLASYVIADGTYMVAFANPIDSKTAIFVSQSPDGPMAPK